MKLPRGLTGAERVPIGDRPRLSPENNRGLSPIVTVGHTGSDGFHRLAHQAAFTGEVRAERYLIVDDFVGQGGTLANLIGYIHSNGGSVITASVLTGKPYSATIAPDIDAAKRLRDKHGKSLENWWQENVGFAFDCFTRSEARYLENTKDADTIRGRIAQARSQDGAGS